MRLSRTLYQPSAANMSKYSKTIHKDVKNEFFANLVFKVRWELSSRKSLGGAECTSSVSAQVRQKEETLPLVICCTPQSNIADIFACNEFITNKGGLQ